jgi:hypothetical protein
MRRLAASLVIALPLVVAIPRPPAASAQQGSEVRLTLVSQSPWLTAEHHRLRIATRAKNTGSGTIHDLSLGVVVFSPVRSRSAYEQSLRTDPQTPVVLDAVTFEIPGSLGPGQSLTIAPDPIDLSFLSSSPSSVYPVKVELRSDLVPVATLRTPLVSLALPPGRTQAETPLNLSWAFVLSAPVLHGPGGTFDGAAVDGLLDRDGRLQQEVAALTSLATAKRPVPLDVVIAPLLLQQLDQLSRGYAVQGNDGIGHVKQGQGDARAAAELLARLRELVRAPTVEVSATPYASPNVPGLVAAGLQDDLGRQISVGRDVVSRVLGVQPNPSLFRPLGSFLDQASLVRLSRLGYDLFLLDPNMVERPPQNKEFAQPAAAALQVGPEPGDTVTALVPDPGMDGLLSSDLPTLDPRLAAQAVLGELAQIWLEEPGVRRSVAVAFTRSRLPGALFVPLLHDVAAAPWLSEEPLTRMADRFRPPGEPATLVPRIGPGYPSWFVALLDGARHDLGTYRSMLAGTSPLPRELESTLLTAESAQFASPDTSGAGFVASVKARLQSEFKKVGLQTAPLFTLPSRGGNIPVVVTSQTGYPIRVDVKLLSNHLSVSSDVHRVEVAGHSKPLLFHVQAKTTGRFPVQVMILTPSGVTLDTGQLVVRSTAYNLVALLVTIGAAVFLLAWWARRFLPRKTA